MESATLAVLHDHYRDSCDVMQRARASRDYVFYLILLVLAVALFDATAPGGFASSLGDVLKSKLGLTSSPDLAYVRTMLWFLLLGLTLRYGQTALAVERHYIYIHRLENTLAAEVPGGFRREGEAYLAEYPLFLKWAHHLYTSVFPALLVLVVLAWTWQQIPGWPWYYAWAMWLWLNVAITSGILMSIALYLAAFYKMNRRRDANDERATAAAVTTEDA